MSFLSPDETPPRRGLYWNQFFKGHQLNAPTATDNSAGKIPALSVSAMKNYQALVTTYAIAKRTMTASVPSKST